MADVLQSQGKLQNALKMDEKGLEIFIQCLGHSHASVAMTKENIRIVHEKLGNTAKAKELYHEAHSIFLQQLGPDHPSTENAATPF
jgi:tetratricopeptide (TPR) repeat protein